MSVPDEVIPYERVPDDLARRVSDPPRNPPEPRPAATVALLRPRTGSAGDAGGGGAHAARNVTSAGTGGSGIEVLLLRRSPSAAFVPGAYVFPGGRVDRDDASAELLERLEGLEADGAGRRLGLERAEPPAASYFVAAVRETFEETGLLVARRSGGGKPPSAAEEPEVERMRRRVLESESAFPEALERLACRMDATAMEYVAHWITPAVEARRYDTRFFAAAVPAGSRAVIDEREMTEALWLTPEEALERRRAGSLPVILPTARTLESLRGFASPEEALAAFRGRRIPTILPRMVPTEEGVGIVVEEAG